MKKAICAHCAALAIAVQGVCAYPLQVVNHTGREYTSEQVRAVRAAVRKINRINIWGRRRYARIRRPRFYHEPDFTRSDWLDRYHELAKVYAPVWGNGFRRITLAIVDSRTGNEWGLAGLCRRRGLAVIADYGEQKPSESKQIIAHELGHLFGADHHISDTIMNPDIRQLVRYRWHKDSVSEIKGCWLIREIGGPVQIVSN